MRNISMSDFVSFMQQFVQQQQTKPKRTAKPKATTAKPKRKVTPQQKAAYLALKATHSGRIPKEIYLAAKAAGQIG